MHIGLTLHWNIGIKTTPTPLCALITFLPKMRILQRFRYSSISYRLLSQWIFSRISFKTKIILALKFDRVLLMSIFLPMFPLWMVMLFNAIFSYELTFSATLGELMSDLSVGVYRRNCDGKCTVEGNEKFLSHSTLCVSFLGVPLKC